jgi:N6-L-threonylcarbamoyladenine synthase
VSTHVCDSEPAGVDLGSIRLIVSAEVPARRQANKLLLPTIASLFEQHNLSKHQICAVVSGRGPGSFTGVRIAIATAKGLAQGLGVPLYGVSTLDAIAWAAWQEGIRGELRVVADAMRGEIYPARFLLLPEGALRLNAHSVVKAEELAARWQDECLQQAQGQEKNDRNKAAATCQQRVWIAGDALYKYAKLFNKFVPLPQRFWLAQGVGLLKVFAHRLSKMTTSSKNHADNLSRNLQNTNGDPALSKGGGSGPALLQDGQPVRQAPLLQDASGDPALLLPIYTRLSDAEENERRLLLKEGVLAVGMSVAETESGVIDPRWCSKPVLRPAGHADIPAMAALEERLFAHRLVTLSGECWTAEMFTQELTQSARSWWVCYLKNRLVGFAGAQVINEKLHVLDLAVDEGYRRRGMARLLLTHLAADGKALGAESITLELRASNSAALALYTSLGLRTQGRRPGYYAPQIAYGPREDALVMTGNIELLQKSLPKQHLERPAGKKPQEMTAKMPMYKAKNDGVDEGADSRTHDGVDEGADSRTHGGVDEGATSSQTGGRSSTQTDSQMGNRAAAQADSQTAGRSSTQTDSQTASEMDGRTGGKAPFAHPVILAIESSCDETAAAVIDGQGQLIANVVASQIDFHSRFGGIVPEIAARKHTETISDVVAAAMDGLSWQQLDAVAVTYAPGLIGALVVGLAFAKGLSWATDLPLIRVNHLEGHIYALRFADITVRPPFVMALLSGGNTLLVQVRNWGDYQVLGATLDDAVGEAYDKVAKALGLGYPGGPVIASLAAQGNAGAIEFPRALLHSGDLSFSLSGLKTAVRSYINERQAQGLNINIANVAAAFEQAVIDVQVAKAKMALAQTGARSFCLSGGVAANTALRAAYTRALEPAGIQVVFPPPFACTDNAAMIAAAALDRYHRGCFAPLDSDAQARANLEEAY